MPPRGECAATFECALLFPERFDSSGFPDVSAVKMVGVEEEGHHMRALTFSSNGEHAKALTAARQALDALGRSGRPSASHQAKYLSALAQAVQGCGDAETAYCLLAQVPQAQAQALQVGIMMS